VSRLNVSLLIPLFFLVVTSLATVARDVDLVGMTARSSEDVHLLDFRFVNADSQFRGVIHGSMALGKVFAKRVFEHKDIPDDVPEFGRFGLVHGFNSLLFVVSLLLVADGMASIEGALLAGLIGVFWLVLPVIEVSEYDRMVQTFDRVDSPESVTFHMLTVTPLILSLMALAVVDLTRLSPLVRAAGMACYVAVGVFVLGNSYQMLLLHEVERLLEYDVNGLDSD